jgi:hypothetical protein
VLLIDVVDSAGRAGEPGDRAWQNLLERHQALVRSEVIAFVDARRQAIAALRRSTARFEPFAVR